MGRVCSTGAKWQAEDHLKFHLGRRTFQLLRQARTTKKHAAANHKVGEKSEVNILQQIQESSSFCFNYALNQVGSPCSLVQ